MQAHIKDSDAASDTTDTREGERATIVRDALRCRMAERTALAQSVAAVARPLILRSDFLPAGRGTECGAAVPAAGLWEHEEVSTV